MTLSPEPRIPSLVFILLPRSPLSLPCCTSLSFFVFRSITCDSDYCLRSELVQLNCSTFDHGYSSGARVPRVDVNGVGFCATR